MIHWLDFISRFWQENTTLCIVILGVIALVVLIYPIVICKTYNWMKKDIEKIRKEIEDDKSE